MSSITGIKWIHRMYTVMWAVWISLTWIFPRLVKLRASQLSFEMPELIFSFFLCCGKFSGGFSQNWYKRMVNSHIVHIPDFGFLEYQIFFLNTLQLIKHNQVNFKEYMPIIPIISNALLPHLSCDLQTDNFWSFLLVKPWR